MDISIPQKVLYINYYRYKCSSHLVKGVFGEPKMVFNCISDIFLVWEQWWHELTFCHRASLEARLEHAATNQQFPSCPWCRSWAL